MHEKPTTYYHYILPNGERRYTNNKHCKSRKNLFQLFQNVVYSRLPNGTKIYFGATEHNNDVTYTGYLLEMITPTLVSLYRVSGGEYISIGVKEIDNYFTVP